MTAEALYSDILQLAGEEDLEEFCGYEKGKIATNWFDEPFPEDGVLLRLTAAALHCTTDYLLGISDKPTPAAETVPTWRTGVPETSGLYAAKFDCSGHVMKKLVYYDNCLYYLHAEPFEYCVSNVRAQEKVDDAIQYDKLSPTSRIDVFDASVFATIRLLIDADKMAAADRWFGTTQKEG